MNSRARLTFSDPVQRLAWALPLLTISLAWCLMANAQAPSIDPRISPHNCEKWEARSRALARSTDPVERQLGELLLQPELSFCQTKIVAIAETKPAEQFEPEWMSGLTSLANLLQWLAIAVLIALLIWLLVRLQPGNWLRGGDERPGKRLPEDRTRDLLDRVDENLDQVLEASERAWQAGDRRLALSLLYRGAIVRIWPHDRNDRARTEGEVLAALRRQPAPASLMSMMRALIRLWQQSAWAHRMPSDDNFREIHQRWAETFGDRGVQDP